MNQKNFFLKSFLLHSKDIEKAGYFWNMMGSMLSAFQSVLLLMVVTRVLDLTAAGIFTLAYASANLFLNIGRYGMSNFIVSDVNRTFSFREYRMSRYLTTAAMLLASGVYAAVASVQGNYSAEKTWVIIWMCIYKAIDAVELVYFSEYQRVRRLDVAGKLFTVRMAFSILLYAVLIILVGNQLTALIVTTFASIAMLAILIALTYPTFRLEETFAWRNVFRLLQQCFPLFLGAFLSFYISNAPKYAIDGCLNDELQACYGFVAMPVFVIGLLNGFLFTPVIVEMSILWNEHKRKEFGKRVARQAIIILGITAVCLAGAYILGIPLLSLLYNTDLSAYRAELLVLLLGGGFLTMSTLLTTIMTIWRIQKYEALGYIAVSIFAFFAADFFVRKYAMMGAAMVYLISMVMTCVIFLVIMLWKGLRRDGEKQ